MQLSTKFWWHIQASSESVPGAGKKFPTIYLLSINIKLTLLDQHISNLLHFALRQKRTMGVFKVLSQGFKKNYQKNPSAQNRN